MRLRKPKYRQPQLFESINEVIQHNWEQLSITGDPKWLIKFEHNRDKNIDPDILRELFFKLHDEFSELTGGSDIMEKWRILIIKRMEARVLYIDGDKSQKNFIELYTLMIDQLMEGSEDVNIIKNRMLIQQMYKQPIDPKKITVPEFQAIIEVVQEMQRPITPTDG